MEPNQRLLPPTTSAVNIELSLNHRRKDLPADSISAIQVKHDASVSLKLPLFEPRYKSEAFVLLSPASPSALETTFVNSLEHTPSASASGSQRHNNTVAPRGSQFTTGALKSNGEECNECASDHTKYQNDEVICDSCEPEAVHCHRLNSTSNHCGSEERALKKQKALNRDSTRHFSPLQRQCRVGFENESISVNDTSTGALQVDRHVRDCRQDPSHGKWNPISELRKFIEEEKEQQNLAPNDDASKEPCEQLETSTDSVESGSEVNPLWVLDSITASVEKCNAPAYDTILEKEINSEIVVDGQSDGITQTVCSNAFGEAVIEKIAGASAPLNQEETGENKRLSQGSDGSFGFEPHYEEDFSGYVEGKEYFKNLPTFHRLLTSAEKKELDVENSQEKELAALRLEDQIPGLHEQSDYAQDMMDTHAMRTEYWDYPYPSRNDAFDTAMGSEDKSELLENMRMKIRGRLRQPGNSSSDSGCQDTDANHSSIDETEATHRIQYQEQDKTQTHENLDNHSADCAEETVKESVEKPHCNEVPLPDHPSSNRRQILEGLRKLIASSEETSYSLPVPDDSNLQSESQECSTCIGSQLVNEAPTIPARPMTHGQLKFVRYENITIVKKRIDDNRNIHADRDNRSDTHSNTHHNKQSAGIIDTSEISKTDNDNRAVHTGNEESVAEPIDIDLSDPDVLEATKRMQLAFRKRRGPNGSIKFRSLQRMRAESDSVSDGGPGISHPASFDKRNPFPGDVSMESCEVQMSRHNSLPPNSIHPLSQCDLSGGSSLTKNKDMTKEKVSKKLSRQKSVSQYEPFPPSLTESHEQKLLECKEVNQPIVKRDQRIEPCETASEIVVVPATADVQKSSHDISTLCGLSSSAKVCEIVKPNQELAETAEGEDVDKKLKCISNAEQQPINTSQCAQIDPVSDTLQEEPDIDLKDPKVQDASKMIQQVFRRKKLFSQGIRGSVEEKACKRVQANKPSSGNAPSIPDTLNALDSKRSSSPSIIYADTTVNVVIAEVDLDKHTISKEQEPVNRTENTSSDDIVKHREPHPVITPAPINCQTYKGVMIVNDKLANHLECDSKPPSPDRRNSIQADATANFRSYFEMSVQIRRASSISEVSLGDDIDIDLLDAEVQAVTEKLLRNEPLDEKSPNDVRMQDQAPAKEQELKKQDVVKHVSNDPQSRTELTNKPLVTDNVNEKSSTNGEVDIDLSDPEVKKTAFKLQSAFRKKRTFSKNKSQITSTNDLSRVNSEIASKLTCKNTSSGATNNEKRRSLIENENGKGECSGDNRNHPELDVNMKGTGNALNDTLETNGSLTSSLKCGEHDNIRDLAATNNDITRARPQISNANTDNLVSTSPKQTEDIDIDLNDAKVKAATKKIQNIFKRKKTTAKKTVATPPGEGESKKSVVRLKSNAAISLGSKHQTKPMISTSFLDRGENGRKETKASMVSSDCHGNTDGDEGMKRASDRCDVGELERTNDSKISDPKGELANQTKLMEGSPLSSIDEQHVSPKTDSTSATTPIMQRDDDVDDDGNTVDVAFNDSAHSGSDQSTLKEGAKGDKFNLDNNGSRPVSALHYADVGPFAMPPASSTASLLRMQDEVDVDNLMTAHVTNGHIASNGPTTSYPTSLTTASLTRRIRDRDDDVDSIRLKSSPSTGTNGKALLGFIDQTSDDTEYETAYSDFSDRVDDELERTLVQGEALSTKLVQMENTIHHHSPRFLIRPKNASCYHGDRTRFVCCITGSPHPDVSWFASGKVVRPEKNNRLQITDYSEATNGNGGDTNACALVSILEIVEVQFLDNGEYACVAINSQGQAFSSAHLKVETRDPGPADESTIDEYNRLSEDSKDETLISSKVNVGSSLQDLVSLSSSSLPRQQVQALVGSKASFFCPVEGGPLPDVRWFKDDIPITCSHGDDRIAVRVEGCIHCLYIRDILLSDAGTYVCSAANDRGNVLCVSFLEVQDSTVSTNRNCHVKEHTPKLVITEPAMFRQPNSEHNPIVSLQTKNDEIAIPLDSSNVPQANASKDHRMGNTDEDMAKMVIDGTAESTNNSPQANVSSDVAVDGSPEDLLNSVLSTYGPREPLHENSGDRLSVLSNDGLTSTKELNSSGNYASAEGPPSDDDQQTKNRIVTNGIIPSESDSLTETKHHKGSKRRSSRRNHIKSPTKTNHSASPGDTVEFIDLDEVNGLSRSKSSRKKRSSSRRKKSPIHSKNVERVRLDLEKAEELTEKVDSCLDIIDDLLTLTSYDENENETEEKLRQKLDTLVQKFADTESDAGSMSSRRSTPSHRRKERLRKVDLLNMSDSNGEFLDGSDVNLNVSKIHSDGNSWGTSSLEDSLKVMSDLVGNISVTVRDPGVEPHVAAYADSAEPVATGREENVNNNNNNIHRKELPRTGPLTRQSVRRTPLRELLKHSLFSKELMTTRVRRRPLPVTKSLDSVDDSVIPGPADGRRRHSFGSLYAPRTTRPSRHPLLRTLSIRRRNRGHSAESSSSDDNSPGRSQGVNVVRRPRRVDTGQVSDDCQSHAESTDSLSAVDQEDKFQQFPDDDRLSSPVGFGDSDCSLEENNLPDPNIRTLLAGDVSFISNTGCLEEYAAVQSAPEGMAGIELSSTLQHMNHRLGQSASDLKNQSERCSDAENGSHLEDTLMLHGNSPEAEVITGDHVSHNSNTLILTAPLEPQRIPQKIGSCNQVKDFDDEDNHPDTLLNVSRNDSGFSSGVSPMLTDRQDRFF